MHSKHLKAKINLLVGKERVWILLTEVADLNLVADLPTLHAKRGILSVQCT